MSIFFNLSFLNSLLSSCTKSVLLSSYEAISISPLIIECNILSSHRVSSGGMTEDKSCVDQSCYSDCESLPSFECSGNNISCYSGGTRA